MLQIHGEVDLARHVDALVVHTIYKEDEAMLALLEEFTKKHGVPIVWMAETPRDRARAAAERARRKREAEVRCRSPDGQDDAPGA